MRWKLISVPTDVGVKNRGRSGIVLPPGGNIPYWLILTVGTGFDHESAQVPFCSQKKKANILLKIIKMRL
jgi:hypothetical protein